MRLPLLLICEILGLLSTMDPATLFSHTPSICLFSPLGKTCQRLIDQTPPSQLPSKCMTLATRGQSTTARFARCSSQC